MIGNDHQGHKSRLRRKAHLNFETLAEHEVLELLLNFGVVRKNMNGVAHELINKFGSFANVCDADLESLMETKEIGEVTASLIKFIPKFCMTYNTTKSVGKNHFNTIEDGKNYFASFMRGSLVEQFYCVALDKNYRIIQCELLGEGGIDEVHVKFKDVLHFAVSNGATSIAIAHSHMNDEAYPSGKDVDFNNKLKDLLDDLRIRLLEHVIVARKTCFSFREASYLK